MSTLEQFKLYIGGEERDAADGRVFESFDPFRGEAWASVARASADAHFDLSGPPSQVRVPASLLGAHNNAVFSVLLILQSDWLTKLRRQGII